MKEDKMRELLDAANRSKQTPLQSGFNVRTAALTKSGKTVLGGNMEYGLTSAIHGEESVIANWLQACSIDDKIVAIAFASDEDVKEDSQWVTSCGNCRDLVKQYCDPNGIFIEGKPDGLFRHYHFSKLYFDSFHPLELEKLDNAVPQEALDSALRAMRLSYDIYTGKTYGASIITPSYMFSAGIEGDVAYHPTLPLRNVITCLKYGTYNRKELNAEKVIVAGPKALDVPYKDRQYLFEFVELLRAAGLRKEPVEVYIIETNEADEPKRAWKTDSDEWLPFPFSPSVLGMEEKMKEYINRE